MHESVKSHRYLSLSEAQVSGRLEEFVFQEEARGIGPADPRRLDEALSRLIKVEKSANQTSRSASSDGLTGKKTR